ncbi:hypothetical protein ACFFRR_011293 [Megaselia abdita]
MKCWWLFLSFVISVYSQDENYTFVEELDYFQFPNIQKVFFEEVLKAKENKSDTCLSQLKTLVFNVFHIKHPKNILSEYRMFESWGRPPSGLTYGHFVDYGNYKECTDVSIIHKKTEIVGKYCTAMIPLNDYFYLVQENRVDLDKLQRKAVHYPKTEPPLGPGFGICIPNACNEKTISKILGKALKLVNLKVAVNRCSIKETPAMEVLDYTALAIFAVILCLVFSSTFYDWITFNYNMNREPLCLAFSLRMNCKKVFNVSNCPKDDNISCLNGIRSLSMAWIILGHTLLWYALLSIVNLISALDLGKSPVFLLLGAAILGVDSFFFLSGLLISWIALKLLDHGKPLNVLYMYSHRLLRLLPVLCISVLFVMTFLKYCGNGPIWSFVLKLFTYPCEKTWWRTLLFIQNYHNDLVCLGQSWYLAVDTQLYFISPLILLGLHKWGKKFLIVLVSLVFLSVGCVFGMYIKNNYTTILPVTIGGEVSDRKDKVYVATHTRYPIWLMGITCGYFMHTLRTKELRIPRYVVVLCWISSLVLIFTIVFGPYETIQPGYKGKAESAAAYDAFGKLGWGLALSWIVFACHFGYGGFINDFLSHPVWQIPSRLSFSMYLAHFPVQMIVFGNLKHSVYISVFDVLQMFYVCFCLTVTVAVFMVLMFESPVIALEKIILGRNEKEDEKMKIFRLNGRVDKQQDTQFEGKYVY